MIVKEYPAESANKNKPFAQQAEPDNGLRLTRRDWPDGRQLSFTVFNMPIVNADGTVGFHTPGDIGEMMLQLNKDMQTRENGTGGNLGAQKVGGAMGQQGKKAEQEITLKQQQELDRQLQAQQDLQRRQQAEHTAEDARVDEAAALKKRQQDEALAAAKRPEEDAQNRRIIGLAAGFVGAEALMMVSNSNGGPFAAFMGLLGLEARPKTLLVGPGGPANIIPGQVAAPQADFSNPNAPRQIIGSAPTFTPPGTV